MDSSSDSSLCPIPDLTDAALCTQPKYMVTCTRVGDFSDTEIEGLLHHINNHSEFAVVAVEKHGDGSRHLHAVLSWDSGSTNNVTRSFALAYNRYNIPYTRHISVKVKKASNLTGAIGYCMKDGVIILSKGWTSTWLNEQVYLAARLRPVNDLMHGKIVLQKRLVVDTIVEYITSHNLAEGPIDERWFCGVCRMMILDGYRFISIHGSLKSVMIHVLCITGVSSTRIDDMLMACLGLY